MPVDAIVDSICVTQSPTCVTSVAWAVRRSRASALYKRSLVSTVATAVIAGLGAGGAVV